MNILNLLFRKNPCKKCKFMRYEISFTSEIINEKIRVQCAYCERWKTLDNEDCTRRKKNELQ